MEHSENTLSLHPFSHKDKENMLDILTSKLVNPTYMLPDFEKREDAAPLFQRLMNLSQDEARFVRGIYLDDECIGFMNDVEQDGGSIEMGYVIHPDHWGKGYMTQALKLAIGELFQRCFNQVVCGAFSQNTASRRVMEKAGMQLIEKSEDIEYRGKTHFCVYYAIDK